MKHTKLKVGELLRMACWHAEQWYESLVDSYGNCTGEEEVKERERNQNLLEQTRAYRLKRWGGCRGDDLRVKPKTLMEVFAEEEKKNAKKG